MKKYTAPPNWPSPPEGWEPPAGWQPDPEWGPAPEGHEFWVQSGNPYPPAPEARVEEKGSHAGRAISITALALAVVSLLLCWVPIVNNLVFFLGLIALAFAIPALVVTIRRKSSSKGMAIAASVIAALSLVGVLATQAFYGSLFESDSSTSSQSSSGDSAPAGSNQSPEAVEQKKLGESAKVGDEYEVTINTVELNATEKVLAANQFNDKPVGQFILVSLSVKYVGADEGTPWIDLTETFVGTDARQYDASDCKAVVPETAMDVPTLEKGGVASYQVCMDVPPAALEGGKLFIEESMSFRDDSRIYWATQ